MIPEQAVKAAAEVVYGDSLEGVTPGFRAFLLNKVRAALEAAAPHMLEPAYEQGWEDGRQGTRSEVWWQK